MLQAVFGGCLGWVVGTAIVEKRRVDVLLIIVALICYIAMEVM